MALSSVFFASLLSGAAGQVSLAGYSNSASAPAVQGSAVPTTAGSNDAATAERWVKIHNVYRCMVGQPPVTWSAEASANAQEYINTLSTTLKHSASYDLKPPYGPAGENLASGAASLEDAAAMWYNEISLCDKFPGCFDEEAREDNVVDLERVGHFTAMTWKGVTKIGCAIKVQPSENLYICRYLGEPLETPDAEGTLRVAIGPQTPNADTYFALNVKNTDGAESKEACEQSAPNDINAVIEPRTYKGQGASVTMPPSAPCEGDACLTGLVEPTNPYEGQEPMAVVVLSVVAITSCVFFYFMCHTSYSGLTLQGNSVSGGGGGHGGGGSHGGGGHGGHH